MAIIIDPAAGVCNDKEPSDPAMGRSGVAALGY
jgi:hypothetical protein